MKRSSEPRSQSEQRVTTVVIGTFCLCLFGFGNFFHKDNAEYFLPNLLLLTLNVILWIGVIACWLIQAAHLWRQCRVRLTWGSGFAFLYWLLVGGAYVSGGAFVGMYGWVLRLAMSDDLR